MPLARPKKNGLSYFPLDADFFEDNKIKILKARYKADGITMYLYLLCEIYKRGYYIKVDDDFEYIISDDLGIDQNKAKQVLNFLLKRSLFDDKLFNSDKVLTSAGIQRRFQLAVKERARKNPVEVGRYWLLSKEETEPFIKCAIFEVNPGNKDSYSVKNECNSTEESLKESKVNNIYNIAFPSKKVEQAFQTYLLVHGGNYTKDGVTSEQEAAMREELLELSTDENEQIAILRKATAGVWKNLHKLKPERKESKPKESKNKFNNFDGRKYDGETLNRLIQQ